MFLRNFHCFRNKYKFIYLVNINTKNVHSWYFSFAAQLDFSQIRNMVIRSSISHLSALIREKTAGNPKGKSLEAAIITQP